MGLQKSYEQQFFEDLSRWLDSQISLMAKAQSYAAEENEHDAEVRYESRLEAYEFLAGKMQNYRNHKPFDALPDGLISLQEY